MNGLLPGHEEEGGGLVVGPVDQLPAAGEVDLQTSSILVPAPHPPPHSYRTLLVIIFRRQKKGWGEKMILGMF